MNAPLNALLECIYLYTKYGTELHYILEMNVLLEYMVVAKISRGAQPPPIKVGTLQPPISLHLCSYTEA